MFSSKMKTWYGSRNKCMTHSNVDCTVFMPFHIVVVTAATDAAMATAIAMVVYTFNALWFWSCLVIQTLNLNINEFSHTKWKCARLELALVCTMNVPMYRTILHVAIDISFENSNNNLWIDIRYGAWGMGHGTWYKLKMTIQIHLDSYRFIYIPTYMHKYVMMKIIIQYKI